MDRLPTHEVPGKEAALRKGAAFIRQELQRVRQSATHDDNFQADRNPQIMGGGESREMVYLRTVELAGSAVWLESLAEQEAKNESK